MTTHPPAYWLARRDQHMHGARFWRAHQRPELAARCVHTARAFNRKALAARASGRRPERT